MLSENDRYFCNWPKIRARQTHTHTHQHSLTLHISMYVIFYYRYTYMYLFSYLYVCVCATMCVTSPHARVATSRYCAIPYVTIVPFANMHIYGMLFTIYVKQSVWELFIFILVLSLLKNKLYCNERILVNIASDVMVKYSNLLI